jgi:pyridoxal phosphate enzyme (YggS family)
MDHRTDELEANLRDVEERIVRACSSAGRSRDDVTLIAVTKTFPADDIRRLLDLGVREVAENRDTEAAPKARALAGTDVRWHFVGQLQTNKARSVAAYADVVQSVDRERLVQVLDTAAVRVGRHVQCLIQVSLDPAATSDMTGRGGAAPSDVPALADLVASSEALVLGGVMAIAPLGADPAEAFARLAKVAERLRADHPDARVISAGMSGDLEQAIAAGATHVRVGTALLGYREPLVR